MRYGEIVSRALAITWRHKYLWLLALFAGEGAASLSTSGSSGNGGGGRGPGRTVPPQITGLDWNQLSSWVGAHAALLWAIGLGFFALFVVLFLVSAVANGALVRGSAEHDDGRPFGLRAAWRAGLGTFRPVLAVKLFVLLAGLATFVVVGGLAVIAVVSGFSGNFVVAASAGAAAAVLGLSAFLFWIVFQVVVLLAVRSIVLDGRASSQALGHGFALLRRRFGRLALVWLLILAIDFVVGLVVGVGVLIVTVGLGGAVAVGYFSGGLTTGIVAGVVLGIAWLAIVLTAAGAVNAFTSTYWTLAYKRLELEPEPAAPVPASPSPA